MESSIEETVYRSFVDALNRGDKICSITEYLDTALLNELLEQ